MGDHDHARGHAFAAAPDLTHVFSLEVLVGEPQEQGLVDGRRLRFVPITGGRRLRFVPITGGRVVGPRLTGDILPGGGDWQSIHPDGLTEVKARYAIRADDGIVIYIANPGVRVASADVSDRLARGEVVDPSLYYFRTGPRFLVADGPHGWLRRTQFVGVGIRRPREVEIRVFAIG